MTRQQAKEAVLKRLPVPRALLGSIPLYTLPGPVEDMLDELEDCHSPERQAEIEQALQQALSRLF